MPEDIAMNMEKKLVPTQATQFPGSFATGLRDDHRKYAESKAWGPVLYNYFTEGWDDIGIWKSAVSPNFAWPGRLPLSILLLTTFTSSSNLLVKHRFVTYQL